MPSPKLQTHVAASRLPVNKKSTFAPSQPETVASTLASISTSETKLPSSINTKDSKASSEQSAIAMSMWYISPHCTADSTRSGTVNPSVQKPTCPGLLTYNEPLTALLTELTVMGNGGTALGTTARLVLPFGNPNGLENGPETPGPDKKKAKTSL